MKFLKITHWKWCSGNIGSCSLQCILSAGWLVICLMSDPGKCHLLWSSLDLQLFPMEIRVLRYIALVYWTLNCWTDNKSHLFKQWHILFIVFVIIMFLFINENKFTFEELQNSIQYFCFCSTSYFLQVLNDAMISVQVYHEMP